MIDIPSVFIVSKSENKNQVHYAMTVSSECMPAAQNPVHAYWRMFEKGPNATEPLLEREEPAYGIARQEVIADVVRIVLRALPSRPITIHTWRNGDACSASATVQIANAPARLFDIHVALGFLRVDYVLVTGWDAGGRVVRERLSP